MIWRVITWLKLISELELITFLPADPFSSSFLSPSAPQQGLVFSEAAASVSIAKNRIVIELTQVLGGQTALALSIRAHKLPVFSFSGLLFIIFNIVY